MRPAPRKCEIVYSKDDYSPLHLRYDMMTQCWVKESWKRPSFSQLVNHISTSLEEMAGYLDITR